MTRKGDLKSYLCVEHVDAAELSQLLLQHFQFRQELERAELYPVGADWMKVEYTKAGLVRTITTSDTFSDDELNSVRTHIRSALVDEQVKRMRRVVALSSRRVEGAAKGICRNIQFQILPPEPGLPLAKIEGAEHPFVLVVEYTGSADAGIEAGRIQRSAITVARFLNLFLNHRVRAEHVAPPQGWSVQFGEPQSAEHRWGQWDTVVGLVGPTMSEFASETPALQQAPASDYYGLRAGTAKSLEIPDLFDVLFERLNQLSDEDFKKFWIAVTWFSKTPALAPAAKSSAFNSLVSAIESLMPSHSQTCQQCSQPVFKISERFKAFLNTYAPGQENEEERKALLSALYNVRSGLAHGLSLLQSDLEPWYFLAGGPKAKEQDELLKRLFKMVRIALINWLLQQRTA